jgi:signal transduction histidine kinase
MPRFDFRQHIRSPAMRELVILIGVVAISYAITSAFDLNEHLVLWNLAHPELDTLDVEDLPFAFMFIALAAFWFAFRRWRQYRSESLAHQSTLDQLRQAMEEVVAANQAKSQFLANMSHELRTPLNAVIGFSEIIMQEAVGPAVSERYRDYARDIHSSGQHLLSVVSDILDMARSEAGVLRFEPATLNLGRLLEEVRRMLAPSAEASGLALHIIGDIDLMIWADPDKFRQALLNVAGNAVKFTPSGGKVTMIATHAGEMAQIQVCDTGIGMAARDIPRALTPFQQIENELQRRFDGAGLGLPLAKRFVEHLGGSLSLESEIGVGTVVTIRVPLSRSVAVAA